MKVLTDAERLEIATRLLSSTNHGLYAEACELMEQDENMSMDCALDIVCST